jgi:hypothetical protein
VALPPLLTLVFLAADRLSPPGAAVEAFAWIFTSFAVGSAAGAALTGPVVAAGVRYGFATAAAAALLAVPMVIAAATDGVRGTARAG